MRGRVVRALREYDELALPELGPRIRVDYGGEYGEAWLRDLLADLADDELVELVDRDGDTVARLHR
jgi:A/G-specific adenine glycosylase